MTYDRLYFSFGPGGRLKGHWFSITLIKPDNWKISLLQNAAISVVNMISL